MKFVVFISIFCVLDAVSHVSANSNTVAYVATPVLRTYPYVYSAHSSSLVTPTQQQYHTQDGLGQYAYGYAEPHSTKHEVRSLDGITRGSYSYRDATGKLQTVDYTADDNGFRVAATNLPSAVSNEQSVLQPFRGSGSSGGVAITAGVGAARDVHLADHKEALLRVATGGIISGQPVATGSDTRSVQLSQPVDDTVTVGAAKASQLNAQAPEEQQVFQHGRVLTSAIVPVPTTIRTSVIPSIYNYGYPLRYFYY
uniref:Cuticle protein 6 n=1 Tax=Zeugodacus cucurbitae TaxID=28588 RepID=A0A0A1WXC5_ZEUCU